jgi:hypothetical protein
MIPERDDRALIINEHDGYVQMRVFNEAGFITSVLLDTTEILGIQAAIKWSVDQCNRKQPTA